MSRALARVLGAAESEENQTETEHPNTGSDEYTEDNRAAGKTQCDWDLIKGKNSHVETMQPNLIGIGAAYKKQPFYLKKYPLE